MNHEYKDLKQIKGKLRSIIYLHTLFNLGLLMHLPKDMQLSVCETSKYVFIQNH